MRLQSIGVKLAVLAGVPVLGALLLSLAILSNAAREARKAESLGSVDAVAELAVTLSDVVEALQAERAWRSMRIGVATRQANAGLPEHPSGPGASKLVDAARQGLLDQERRTNAALAELDRFLAHRDLSRLPVRLQDPLRAARDELGGLDALRKTAPEAAKPELVIDYYGRVAQKLIDATAALSELSDDGDLLRLITALVAVHDLKERASREHAVLATVFARGGFPPGFYRMLVTVVTEQDVYDAVFRTTSSREQIEFFESRLRGDVVRAPQELREQALAATEEEVEGDPLAWFEHQRRKVAALGEVADGLNARVRTVVEAKRVQTTSLIALSVSLASGVLVISVLLAFFVGRGISRSVTALRDATQRVATGDLEARVRITAKDEIGELGEAFNRMTQEIADARAAQIDQARMSRELEIAASIQSALLPPAPEHPDFEFAGRMVPADEVGGDFYDVLASGDRLWLTVGDVSNHGLSAGLVMLMAQSTFAGFFSSDPTADPDAVIRGVNRVLHANISDRLKENKYLTAQLLAYRGDGRFVCAGAHEWPIVYRAATRRCEVLPAAGPWLAILPDLDDVPLSELALAPGDVLCLYSDGLIEARDATGEQFDVPRLAALLEAELGADAPLERVLDAVYAAVRTHVHRQDDDWSMLLARRRKPPAAAATAPLPA